MSKDNFDWRLKVVIEKEKGDKRWKKRAIAKIWIELCKLQELIVYQKLL
ncbi:hypothetical protein ACQV2T_05200 [Facklamia sp. P13069]